MVTLAQIMTAITSALNADLGTNDLSATGAVLRGRYLEPPAARSAFVCVCSPAIQSVTGPGLRDYTRTLSIDVFGWVAYDGASAASRAVAAELLADEMTIALENVRSTLGSALYHCPTFEVRSVALDSDADPGPPGYARCVLVVELSYTRKVT